MLGGHFGEGWNVKRPGQQEIDILEAPRQELQAWLTKAANEKHIEKAGERRTALRGIQSYDHRATVAGRPEPNSKNMLHG